MADKFVMRNGRIVKVKSDESSAKPKSSKVKAALDKGKKPAKTKKPKVAKTVKAKDEHEAMFAVQLTEGTRFLVYGENNDDGHRIIRCAKQYKKKGDTEWSFAKGGFILPSVEHARKLAEVLESVQ